VIVANYFNIFWAFLWGILLLGEKPVWLSLVGMGLILVNAGIAVNKAFRAKPKAAAIASTAEVPYLSVTPRQSGESNHVLTAHEVEMGEIAEAPPGHEDESTVPMLAASTPHALPPN